MLGRMNAKLITLCLVPTILLAQDPAPDPTAQALKSSHALVRLPSAERIDAIGKDMLPMIKGLLPAEIAGVFEKGSASSLLIAGLGLGGKEIARDKPIYLSPLPNGVFAIASGKNGLLTAGPEGTAEAAKRGKPTAMLAGDISVHVFAGKLIAGFKPKIEQGLNMAAAAAGGFPMVPDPMRKLLPTAMDLVREVIYGIESFDYSLTLKDNIFESEGRVTTKEGSNFRKMLAAAGAPQDNILVGYLPRGALVYSDGAGFEGMGARLAAVLENHLGEGAGLAYGHMSGPDIGSWGVTTGRAAASVAMQGMMMGRTYLSIYELKDGIDGPTAIAKFDSEKVNAALKKHGIGLSYKLLKDVAVHGETKMHKIEIDAQDPMLGMMTAGVETYVAVEGRLLLVVQSANAETDMKALIDRARGQPDMEHPHIKAMSRLGRKRHTGITFNVSGIKPFGMMLNMFAPKLGKVVQDLPDNLTMSTAFTMADGNIHWRGDWPVKEMAAFAVTLKEMAEGAVLPGGKAPDEDFDDD
jgi:hypothetical protein